MAAETLTRRAFGSHPAVLARLEEGAGQLEDDPRADGGGVPARVDLLRLRRPALPDRDARVRLVDAVGGPAAPGRARDATCHGCRPSRTRCRRASGRNACSAPCRSPAPRSSAIASGIGGCSSSSAFVVQALIFGAGHAPYPAQPSFARPVELILPSIGFGLLYLYFGLLPGIILHFAFDVVWFALPIFLAKAPGIWVQQAMVVRDDARAALGRARPPRSGRTLDGARRIASATRHGRRRLRRSVRRTRRLSPGYAIGNRMRTIWLGVGTASLVACAIAVFTREPPGSLSIGRSEAAAIARGALEARGVKLGPDWRILPTPLDGSDGPHEFVAETAGNERRKALVGTYLPAPRWYVRVAKFEGDVADRAEEWQMSISAARETRIRHVVPEERPGASLEENTARQVAQAALAERTGLGVGAGQAREISARPQKLKARTDWTFTFADTTIAPLPQGEPRIDVVLAGSEVASVGRYVHVPEDWERSERAASTRNTILRILTGVVFGGLLVAAAVLGVIAWSRGRYAPRLFFATAAVMLVASIADAANGWPAVLASLQTALPLPLQILGVIGIGLVALTVTSSLAGLAIGALPHRLANAGELADRDALRLGVAAGLFAAAVSFAAVALRTPDWAAAPARRAARRVRARSRSRHRSHRRLHHATGRAREPVHVRPRLDGRVDAPARARRDRARRRRVPRRGRARRDTCWRLGSRRPPVRRRSARHLHHAAARRPDDGAGDAGNDDGDRRPGRRGRTAVPRRACGVDPGGHAARRRVMVVVPRAPPRPRTAWSRRDAGQSL